MIPPLGRVLVAGEGTWPGGVSIPNLPSRLHELPPSDELTVVVGAGAGETVAWLLAGGRFACVSDEEPESATSSERPAYRLWSPNRWLEACAAELEPTKALDIGCGSGRDSVYLAGLGWKVCAIDQLPDAIVRGQDLEERYLEHAGIQWISADAHEAPNEEFGLILMLRCYLPSLLNVASERLSAAGSILIQSFTEHYRQRTGHPGNPDYIFRSGDLDGQLVIADHHAGEKWQQIRLTK